MQSILQYRRFKRHVVDQYERDREKATAFRHHESTDTSSTEVSNHASSSHSSTGTAPVIPTSEPLPHRDLEKADGVDNGADDDHEQIPSALNSEGPVDLEREGERPDMLRTVTTVGTQASIGTRMGIALTGIVPRSRTTREGGGHGKVFVVGYEGEKDPLNPHNWSRVTRWCATFTVASIGFIVGFASSIDSAALPQASAEFNVSEVTESLATGLFLIGFGCGALFAGPISETVGRNPVYIVTLTIYMIFIMASGLAPNIGLQLAFRFLAGLFGSTPLTCAGGSVSDLWGPMERVYAFPVFANAAFMGPIFGPVVGGFIGESSRVSWRWCEWITLIISGLILVIVVLFQPETYAPILLKWKAAHLREFTGDDRYRAEIEVREETFLHRIRKALYRPFALTFQEPIIMLVALYLTVIYILLFTFLDGYTYIFIDTYGFSQGITGLVFIGIGIGLCFASLLVPVIYVWAQRDLAKIQAEGGDRLPPEFRLWFGMFGAPAIPIAIFWLGWTAYPSISYWCPLVATVVFGYGILCIFISCYQYIIDSYETFAASALASVTLIRYVAAGAMVEVAIPMYGNLGVHWTLTVLGAISTLMVPVPYLFYFYGKRIRGKSKYTVTH